MRRRKIAIFIVLFVSFIFDLVVPMRQMFNVDLTLVSLFALNNIGGFSYILFMSLFFGLAKDALVFNGFSWVASFFILSSFLTREIFDWLGVKKFVQYSLLSIICLCYVLLHSFLLNWFSFHFMFWFIVRSLLAFFVIERGVVAWTQR